MQRTCRSPERIELAVFGASLLIMLSALALPSPAVADDPRCESQIEPEEGELLPTGFRITPEAACGARFKPLNPELDSRPDFRAGQAVTSVISPDGRTMLVLTSGYNRNYAEDGEQVDDESNEYVFVYDVQGDHPKKRQVLQLPNTFGGVAFGADATRFYVSGGVDDNVHEFVRDGELFSEVLPPISLGHEAGLGLQAGLGLENTPLAAGLAVSPSGTRAVVANMGNDSISVLDLDARKVLHELDLRPGKHKGKRGTPGGSYPYWVVVRGEATAFVSSLRDDEVMAIDFSRKRARVTNAMLAFTPPMGEIFAPREDLADYEYNAIVPEVLRTTELPLPEAVASAAGTKPQPARVAKLSRPAHDAAYWQRAMAAQDFRVEDKLDEARFNRALWRGLMGHAAYPSARSGLDLRANRAQLLATAQGRLPR